MKVDPQAVRAIAGTVHSAAEEFDRGYVSRSAGLAPAVAEDQGWATAQAVRSAVTEWEVHVRRLSSAVTVFGSDLLTAATDYEATDQQAASIVASTAPGGRVVGP